MCMCGPVYVDMHVCMCIYVNMYAISVLHECVNTCTHMCAHVHVCYACADACRSQERAADLTELDLQVAVSRLP